MNVLIITTKEQLSKSVDSGGKIMSIIELEHLRRYYVGVKNEGVPMIEAIREDPEEEEEESNTNDTKKAEKFNIFKLLSDLYERGHDALENYTFKDKRYNDHVEFEKYAIAQLPEFVKSRYPSRGLHQLYNKQIGGYSVWIYGVTKLNSSDNTNLDHTKVINALIKDIVKIEGDNFPQDDKSVHVILHNGDVGESENKYNISPANFINGVGKQAGIFNISSFSHTGNGVHIPIQEIKDTDGSKINEEWCIRVMSYLKKGEEILQLTNNTNKSYQNME